MTEKKSQAESFCSTPEANDTTEEPVPTKTYWPFGCLVALHSHPQPRSPAGLVYPDGSKAGGGVKGVREADMATVIAVGPECKQVKEGDVVFFAQEVLAQRVVVRGQLTILVREDHLGGIVYQGEEVLH